MKAVLLLTSHQGPSNNPRKHRIKGTKRRKTESSDASFEYIGIRVDIPFVRSEKQLYLIFSPLILGGIFPVGCRPVVECTKKLKIIGSVYLYCI